MFANFLPWEGGTVGATKLTGTWVGAKKTNAL